jgi:hypothetical protein
VVKATVNTYHTINYKQLAGLQTPVDAYKALQRGYPDENGGERSQESEYGKKRSCGISKIDLGNFDFLKLLIM